MLRFAGTFMIHLVISMVGTMLVGFMLLAGVRACEPAIGGNSPVTRLLFDVPYSPFFWGIALLMGFFMNRWLRQRSAHWVWVAGLTSLSIFVWDVVRHHDPRWCEGCSIGEGVWRNFFTVQQDCLQECLGELFATAPALALVAYSIGACLATVTRSRQHAPTAPEGGDCLITVTPPKSPAGER